MAGGGRAVQRVSALKSARLVALASDQPSAAGLTPARALIGQTQSTTMTIERPMFPPVDPTRRRFLSTTAGIATAGATLALAGPPARAVADPVFALIEAHKATDAALAAACAEKSRLEEFGDWNADCG